MADQTSAIKYVITVDGADAGSRSFQNLAGQMGRTEAAFNKLAKPANDNSRAFDQLAQRGQRVTQTLGAIGLSLGRLEPSFGALGASVGRATGAIGSMTALLGGPWGLAIGAGIAALGFFSEAMRNAEKSTEALTEDMRKQAYEAMKLAQAREQVFPIGGARVGASQAADRRYRRNQNIQAQLAAAVNYGGGVTNDQSLADLEAQVALAEKQGQIGPNIEDRKGSGVNSGEAYNELLQQQARARFRATADRYRMDRMGRVADLGAMSQDTLAENRKGLNAQFGAGLENSFDNQLSQLDEMTAAYDALGQAGQDAFKDIGAASIQALAAVARGEKDAGKMLLATIGNTLVGRGTDALWQGIIMSANPLTPGLGAPLIAAGTAAIAAGIALGAAGASGGGGGGGGNSRPASPAATPNNQTYNASGGQRSVIVNMPTVVAPGPQDGARVRAALREADRHGV